MRIYVVVVWRIPTDGSMYIWWEAAVPKSKVDDRVVALLEANYGS